MLDNLHENVPVEVKDMTDADLKTRINTMIDNTLPRRAKKKRWKVKDKAVFRRMVYDAVFNKPWEQAVNPPAIRNMNRLQMQLVLTVCMGVFEGKIDPHHLLARSDAMR